MGGGAHPFMVEPLAQVAGEFRENRGILHRIAVAGGSSDLLAEDYSYLRINSKAVFAKSEILKSLKINGYVFAILLNPVPFMPIPQ